MNAAVLDSGRVVIKQEQRVMPAPMSPLHPRAVTIEEQPDGNFKLMSGGVCYGQGPTREALQPAINILRGNTNT